MTRWKAHSSNVRSSPVASLSVKGEVPVCFHPVGQMKGSRGSLVLFHSDFLYAQELTEAPVLGSKETFPAKAETAFKITVKCEQRCRCSSCQGWGTPLITPRGRGGAVMTVRWACFSVPVCGRRLHSRRRVPQPCPWGTDGSALARV